MKKLLSVIMLMVILLVFSTPISASAATTISQSEASIYIGETLKLSVSDADKYVLWKSNNKSVATVTKGGKVTGKGKGTAKITATIGSGKNNQKLSCNVIVNSRLSSDDKNIVISEDEYQEVTINWADAEDNEMLIFENDSYSASAEWVDDDYNYILRILPEDIGFDTISVYTTTSTSNEDINYDDELKLNVFVVEDADWIPEEELEDSDLLGINDLIDLLYDSGDTESGNIIYNGKSISCKYKDYELYFNTDDLRSAGII